MRPSEVGLCSGDGGEDMRPSISIYFSHLPRARFMAEALRRGLGLACLTIDDQSGLVNEAEVPYPLLYDDAVCEDELMG